MSEFENLLKALSDFLGGGVDLTPKDGTVILAVDDMRLTLVDAETAIAIVGIVGQPPPEERIERLYRALLEANHLFSGTGGATFSIDSSNGEISLCRTIPYVLLSGDQFCEALTQFVNTLESWIRLVADYRSAKDEPEPTPGLSDFNAGFMSV